VQNKKKRTLTNEVDIAHLKEPRITQFRLLRSNKEVKSACPAVNEGLDRETGSKAPFLDGSK
jgi:hypothetical protein